MYRELVTELQICVVSAVCRHLHTPGSMGRFRLSSLKLFNVLSKVVEGFRPTQPQLLTVVKAFFAAETFRVEQLIPKAVEKCWCGMDRPRVLELSLCRIWARILDQGCCDPGTQTSRHTWL